MTKALNTLLFGSAQSGSLPYEIAYTLFRFYCGLSIAIGAGWSKVFHKIDEEGGRDWDNLAFGVPVWFVEQVGDIGFTFISPSFWAHLAVYGEFIGGLLIAFGLLTRVSALQLAFQFFVVSFIWYDEPELFAMYYQQLLFWGFVLIAALGGGRFSLDHLLRKRALGKAALKPVAVAASLLMLPLAGFSQDAAPPVRVSFTVSNPTLKGKSIDIRYFNSGQKKSSGYGYRLNGLSAHAVNMPAGTRVYVKKADGPALAFVVTAGDGGRKFDVTKTYEISREQLVQAARDEMGEQQAQLAKAAEQPDLETMAREKGLPMVDLVLSGKTAWNKQVFVRAQLPFDNQKSNLGFSRKLNRFSRFRVSYPVGTKVYLCDGPYWNGGKVNERLVLTVEAEKAHELIRI